MRSALICLGTSYFEAGVSVCETMKIIVKPQYHQYHVRSDQIRSDQMGSSFTCFLVQITWKKWEYFCETTKIIVKPQ